MRKAPRRENTPEDDMVEFDTAMSERDFRSLVYFTTYSKHTWVPAMMICGMALALMVAVTSLFGIFQPSPFLKYASWGYIAIIALLLFLTDRNIKKMISEKKVSLNGRQHIAADKTALTCSVPLGSRHKTYKWKDLEQIYETGEYFIIYISGRTAFIFNKSTIGRSHAIEFHDLLVSLKTAKYNDRSKKRPAPTLFGKR